LDALNFDGITELSELTEFMNGLPEDYSPHELLARKIIGLAMKVHRALGCGFVESIYRGALAIELRSAQIEFEIHPVLPVFYKGEEVGVFQADLIIENRLIVELKAVEALTVPILFNLSIIWRPLKSTTASSSTSERRASNSKPNTALSLRRPSPRPINLHS